MSEAQTIDLLKRIEPVIAQFAKDHVKDRAQLRKELGRLLIRTEYDEAKGWRQA